MSNILLIDAATEALSVAVSCDLKNAHFEVCPQQHSQKMLPLVDSILNSANTKLKALDAIAFGRGPGSFTGVRVGVSVTQGLAYAANLTVIGVSNLQMMAQQAFDTTEADYAIATIDARMGEIYYAEFKRDENNLAAFMSNEMVIKPEELTLPEYDAVVVGTGCQTYKVHFEATNLTILDEITLPNARFMATLAERELIEGNTVVAADAQPVYVRDTVTWKKLPGRE
ncbi:tRNA threonylcarbamoyladenosine biosynthesis protein TsaB [Pseudoalteromonas sp. P1-9]|uniref:tRNA (adenosine(37)-N6)-threonylcarbamoyltransferase complex dimerization subunit type 1 TsaB n=1 Tax=Pseudoalteromonas sp. P1-9 TaxID=1710354 RepID=UPI0006D60713|nr:tRNA (adenosine(37)-N6)-threonylcarbamoyltransferase complex dimerization subunit type 1 TsaB [Pseudoalteromonas sp. P1-9]KPV95694.1 tRNA threonylcarbamoyladenosine biosynthesis protein TsaB [Pseudoalteromonas sp. P1-9]